MKFTIFKNQHYSLPFFIKPHFNIKKAEFIVKFDKNCWYKRDDVEHTGINKLCGLGFGLNHQNNSIRVGWQPDFEKKNVIKLHIYWYDMVGSYQEKYICSINTKTRFKLLIDLTNICTYTVHVNPMGTTYHYQETVDNLVADKNWGLWLRPYFGGKSKAPKKMKIWIKKKKLK